MVDVVAPPAEPGRNHAPIALRAGGSAINAAQAAATAALEAPAEWVGVDVASAGLAARDDARERLEPARVLFANADEAAALTGREPEAAARELAKTHEVVVVKLGPERALGTTGN